MGRQIRSVDALGSGPSDTDHDTVTVYDTVGAVLLITDPEGNAASYAYDRLGRLTAETDSLDNSSSFHYDVAGQLVKTIDRNGRVIKYTYDDLGRQTAENWYDDVDDTTANLTYTTTYDDAGQVLTIGDADWTYDYTYNDVGAVEVARMEDTTSGNALAEFTYTYDAAGNVKSRTDDSDLDTSLAGTTSYDHDPLGRLTTLIQSGTGVTDKRVDFTYADDGAYDTITRYAGDETTDPVVAVSVHGHDDLGRLNDLNHHDGVTPTPGELADYQFTYDAAGRVTTLASDDGDTDFSHDDTDQLTVADHDYQTDEAYTYDANGNRTNGSYSTVADSNRLASDGVFNYVYDDEGARLSRTRISGSYAEDHLTEYEWDHRNRLVSVTFTDNAATPVVQKVVEYTYDPMDRLIGRTVDDPVGGSLETEQTFAHDGSNLALAFDAADDLTHRYLFGSAVDQILAVEDAAGDVLWGLADHQGTIRDVIEHDSGQSPSTQVVDHRKYDSFGRITSQTDDAVDFVFAYTGRPLDEDTGLSDYRARWYDPDMGRFLSEDPAGFVDDVNPYRYVGNRPMEFSDPSGMWSYRGVAQAIGGAIGSGVGSISSWLGGAASSFGGAVGGVASTPITTKPEPYGPALPPPYRPRPSIPTRNLDSLADWGPFYSSTSLLATPVSQPTRAAAASTPDRRVTRGWNDWQETQIAILLEETERLDRLAQLEFKRQMIADSAELEGLRRENEVRQRFQIHPVYTEAEAIVENYRRHGVATAVLMPGGTGEMFLMAAGGFAATPVINPAPKSYAAMRSSVSTEFVVRSRDYPTFYSGSAGLAPSRGLGRIGSGFSAPSRSNPVNLSTAGRTAEGAASIREYARRTNQWLDQNGPQTIQGTKGALRREASAAARAERLRAARAGQGYTGQAGHVPDTAVTGQANPPAGWLDMPGTTNQSAGAPLGSRIGQRVDHFTVDGELP